MSTTESPKETLLTAEEFLSLPDDGSDRQLIRGRLMEKPMTYGNRTHAWIEAQLTFLLKQWLQGQELRAGELYSGEVGCVLRRDPDTIVGIDIAYFARETVDGTPPTTTLIEGAPLLAVEILSPSDKQAEIHGKVVEYLQAGTRQVWIVDPYFRTVQVHAPERPPEMFNEQQTLTAAEVLPGFELQVSEMFPA